MDERMRMNDMGRSMGSYPIRNERSMMRRNRRQDRARQNDDMRRGRDRGMFYPYDMRGGDMARGYDMRGQGYGDMRMDGHHPQAHGSTYYPIQAMGTFEGYYGMPNQQDHARGARNDYGYDMRYDMRGGRNNDYGYPMQMHHYPMPPYDYGYPVGDFGETLSEQELEEWKHKLMSQLDEQERQMFSHEAIMQRARQLGRPMEGFGEKELCLATLMIYTDYKQDMGKNPDLAVKFAYDWLADKDVAVKGAEKLAVYYDEIVEGGK